MKWLVGVFLLAVVFALMGLWALQDPGTLTLVWLGYEITLSIQLAIILILFFVFILFALKRFFSWLFHIPIRWIFGDSRSHDLKLQNDLLEFFSAYEAEDFLKALSHLHKSKPQFLVHPLVLWISGNLYEKTDQPFEAEKSFMELTKNTSTVFLGLKGQIRAALHREDFKTAYSLLKRSENLYPRSPWVLKHLVALSRERKKLKEAEEFILRLEDLGYFSSDQSKKQIALLQYQASLQPEISLSEKETLLRQAHYLDPTFIEVTKTLAPLLVEQGHLTYALSTLQASWKVAPSYGLGELFQKISHPDNEIEAYKLVKDFVKDNPNHPESLLLLASAALKAHLWGEARAHLKELIEKSPSSEAYHLFAQLELSETHDLKAAIKWLELGLKAPRRP